MKKVSKSAPFPKAHGFLPTPAPQGTGKAALPLARFVPRSRREGWRVSQGARAWPRGGCRDNPGCREEMALRLHKQLAPKESVCSLTGARPERGAPRRCMWLALTKHDFAVHARGRGRSLPPAKSSRPQQHQLTFLRRLGRAGRSGAGGTELPRPGSAREKLLPRLLQTQLRSPPTFPWRPQIPDSGAAFLPRRQRGCFHTQWNGCCLPVNPEWSREMMDRLGCLTCSSPSLFRGT